MGNGNGNINIHDPKGSRHFCSMTLQEHLRRAGIGTQDFDRLPKLSLAEGLELTAACYKAYLINKNMR